MSGLADIVTAPGSLIRVSWRSLILYATAIGGPLLAGFLWKLYRHRKRWRELDLPGPPHEIFFGHLRVFQDHAARFKGRHIDYTAESIATGGPYGRGLVFLDLWPFAPPMCLISDPQVADQIVRVDNLPKCLDVMKVHFPIFGDDSLALAAGDDKGEAHWKTVRRAIAPGFKKGHLERSWTQDVVDESAGFVERLKKRSKDAKPAIMAEYLVETTLDLILRVTIGCKDPRLSQNLLAVLNSQLEHASNTGIVNALFSALTPLRRFGEKRRSQAMYSLLAPIVEEHIQDSREKDPLSKQKIDVLDWALANHPDFSVTSLVDQVKTFILAGHDTASSTLAWTYYHLSQSPEVLRRLRQEHDTVFGGRDSVGREGEMVAKDPTILNDLKYTLAVMRETLRLYPPAAAVRQANSDVYVVEHLGAKYSVAGCMLWVNHWCLHRSKATWGADAGDFKPERWFQSDGDLASVPLAWQPFSKGPRNCIGMEFGLIEQKVILAMTVRQFDFTYAGAQDPYQIFRLTAQPSNGIPMYIASAV